MGTKHGGILGRTRMGKSVLAKFLCKKFTLEAKRITLVYDITLSDEAVKEINDHKEGAEWVCTFATNDEETFLAMFWALEDIIAFIEEGNETAGRFNQGVKFTATRGSHQIGELGAGSSIFYIAHSYTDLNKTLRTQIGEFYIFRCSKESAVGLEDEFDEPRLRQATKLPVGQFYHVDGDQPLGKYRVNMEAEELEPIDD